MAENVNTNPNEPKEVIPTPTQEPAAPQPPAVTFTPEQMQEANRIAEERAQRAGNSALKNYFQQQGMTGEEIEAAVTAYKAQKAAEKTPEQLAREAQQTANTRIQAAKQSLVKMAAQSAAAQLSVKPERVEYALRLADLSAVEVGDDMAVDTGAITAALQKVLEAVPELAAAPSVTPAANPASILTVASPDNPWSKDGFNLTEQGRIMRSDPKLAAKMKAAAGAL